VKELILAEGLANREFFQPRLTLNVRGFHTDVLARASNHFVTLW